MSEQEQQAANEGIVGQSASTGRLEDSAVLDEAFEMWAEAMMPSFKVLRPRERTIAKSAFRCAWQAREVYERMSSNNQVQRDAACGGSAGTPGSAAANPEKGA